MKLSVVIPAWNAESTLGAQLEALAGQAWEGDWEVIVADNGSTDGTRAVAAAWAGRLPGLCVVDASERRGAAHARNRGAEEAAGEALAFVDADDVVAPGWLAAISGALDRWEMCASRFDFTALNPGRADQGSQRDGVQWLWYSPHVPHAGGSGLAIHRHLHERLGGFDEGLRWLEDTDYCIRAAAQGIDIGFAADAEVRVRLRPEGRAAFRQARLWARSNVLLYARHRTEAESWRSAWGRYVRGWAALARRTLRRRGAGRAGHWQRQAAWKLGLLEGSLRCGVAPPEFPRGGGKAGSGRTSGTVRRGDRDGGLLRIAVRRARRSGRAAAKRLRRRRMGTLVSVRTERPVVALTFDDGPDPANTPAVLDILARHGARATFFLVGRRAARHPALVHRIVREGHAVGNHSWSHRSAHDLTSGELAGELRRTEAVLPPGPRPRWFRPPFGELGESAWRTARAEGFEVVGWNLLSGDWRRESADVLASRLKAEIAPGAIVLLHDTLTGAEDTGSLDRSGMREALEQVLASLAGRFEFVRLDELLAAGRPVRRPVFPGRRPRGAAAAGRGGRENRPWGVDGRLRVTRFTVGGGQEPAPGFRTSTWVVDRWYRGMEDNDVRGYLDGGFQWAWNQPTQVHVRLGRMEAGGDGAGPPPAGEPELFRVLHRWDGIELPPGARVEQAELTLAVERGCPRPLDLCLYEVRRDWNPGAGGVFRNNVSVAAPGEVWWNEAAAGAETWTKPGAGHAAEGDPLADTGAMPLARARYRPGAGRVTFRSRALARYADRRLDSSEPLLFLVKLSDADEDVPGSLLVLHSANRGDDWNPRWRPRLRLRWSGGQERERHEIDVRLEYGRSLPLDLSAPAPDERLLFAWTPAARGGERPSILWTPAGANGGLPRELPLGRPVPAEEGTFRLVAAANVVLLGGSFRCRIADTWVLSGPPEVQDVEWTFLSPTGRRAVVPATYAGAFRWDVAFRPGELGRWRCTWSHRFQGETWRSPEGRFDVVAASLPSVLHAVEDLAAEIRAGRSRTGPDRVRAWTERLLRLERAAVALVPAAEWRMNDGRTVRRAVNEARAALCGRPLPDDFPAVSHERVMERDGVPLRDPYPRWKSLDRTSHGDARGER